MLQNLIPSFPWIVPHPGTIQEKKGFMFGHLDLKAPATGSGSVLEEGAAVIGTLGRSVDKVAA